MLAVDGIEEEYLTLEYAEESDSSSIASSDQWVLGNDNSSVCLTGWVHPNGTRQKQGNQKSVRHRGQFTRYFRDERLVQAYFYFR